MNKSRDEERIKAFGANVRRIRKARKFKLKDLAFEADIELSQVHRVEIGKVNPTLTTILLLADALQISPSELFDYYKK